MSEPILLGKRSEISDETKETEDTSSTETETTEEDSKSYESLYEKAAWNIEETVIYEDKGVTITAKELIKNDYDNNCGLALWIENNYTSDLIFTVNDLCINTLCSFTSKQNELLIEKEDARTFIVAIDMGYLSSFGITDISRVDLSMAATNSNNYRVLETDLMRVDTDFTGDMQTPSVSDMILVAENQVVEIYIQKWIYNDETRYFELYVTNKSEQKINLSTITLSFGGKDLGGAIKEPIPAGMSYDLYFDLNDPVALKSIDGKGPATTMTISFGYKFPNTLDYDWKSEPVTLSLE